MLTFFGGPLRPMATWLKVIVLLVGVDLLVRGPFFTHYLAPLYVDPFAILRDRTWGQNVLVLLKAMRSRPSALRVTFLGDSVVRSADQADDTSVPYLLQRQLRARFHSVDLEVVDASEIGLRASDAVLLTSKLVGAGSDVIVYEVLPRALPRSAKPAWTIRVSDELSPADLWRLARVGGRQWLAQNVGGAEVADGLVNTTWALYGYRANLKLFVWDVVLPRVFPYPGLTVWMFYPPHRAAAPALGPPQRAPGEIEWTWAKYGPPNANWEALDLLARICQAYLPGRCVIYSGPINPLARAHVAEPRLFNAYLTYLRSLAGRHGLEWRDYTDSMTPADFAPPKYGAPHDSIHLNSEGNAKLAQLLAAPVAGAVERAERQTDAVADD
jgi:hypothetical protein